MKLKNKFLHFMFDTMVAYVFAMVMLVPFVNTLMLRTLMEDSNELEKILSSNYDV